MDPSEAFHNHIRYFSYLLRIWQAGAKGAPVLRFQLVNPQTGQRWNFQSMAEVMEFLEKELMREKKQDQ